MGLSNCVSTKEQHQTSGFVVINLPFSSRLQSLAEFLPILTLEYQNVVDNWFLISILDQSTKQENIPTDVIKK